MTQFNRQEAQQFILTLATDTCNRQKTADTLKLQTQALAASRVDACKAYATELPALFQDLENGLFEIQSVNSDFQKRSRQAWRRSWEKALNKAFQREGCTIVYKGTSPSFIEAEIVTEKMETTADKVSAFLETLALSPDCKSRVLALINMDMDKTMLASENAPKVGEKIDLAKAA